MALSALTRWLVAGTVVVSGACTPVTEAAMGEPFSLFPAAYAASADSERTLAFGYGAIYERYVNRVTVGDLAVEGIRGFASVDESLGADRDGGKVFLNVDGRRVVSFDAAADNDAVGWARITLAAADEAKRRSEKMKQASEERILESAFDATLAKLDPFSRYSSPTEARSHRANRNGFAGIGVRYEKNGPKGIEILSVIPESPAGDAGIHDGDVITHVDGMVVPEVEIEKVSDLLRGDVGTQVTLGLLRKSDQRPVNLTLRRAMVIPPTVTMSLDDGVANIKVSGFNQRTAAGLTNAVREARASLGTDLKGVLLDLRGNPGGLLDQAVAMADLFMAQGRIVSTQGRHRHASQTYDANSGDFAEDLPLVLLVDGKSASASEILAAALQDSGRAVVIGTNSYGKGTVQTVIRMPNDGEMTLTWSRFHSPTGYALHGLGVLPTICTSEGKQKVVNLLKTVRDANPAIAKNLAAWRASGIDQTDLRKQLRATCPSEKHADNVEEAKLGESLLRDKALYARALAVSLPSYREVSTGVVTNGEAVSTQAEVKAN